MVGSVTTVWIWPVQATRAAVVAVTCPTVSIHALGRGRSSWFVTLLGVGSGVPAGTPPSVCGAGSASGDVVAASRSAALTLITTMSRSSPELSTGPDSTYPRATSSKASARVYRGGLWSPGSARSFVNPSALAVAARASSSVGSSATSAACWEVRYRVTATSRAARTAAASSAGRYAVICTVPSLWLRVVTRRCSSARSRSARPARNPRTARSSCAAV